MWCPPQALLSTDQHAGCAGGRGCKHAMYAVQDKGVLMVGVPAMRAAWWRLLLAECWGSKRPPDLASNRCRQLGSQLLPQAWGWRCCSRLVRSGRCSGPRLGVDGCRQAGQEHSQLVCALMAAAEPQSTRPATSPSPAAPPHTHSTGCLPVYLLWVADWADRTASFRAMK